jgi:hypothetical protein
VTVVSLKKVLEALDFVLDDVMQYVDPATGAIVVISEEELGILEGEDPATDLPAWQQEVIDRLRKVDIDKLVPLPTKFDIHEWDIMRRFCDSVSKDTQRAALFDAIHGAGAFRTFRREVERLRLEDAWFAFRADSLERIARDWAKQNGLEYADEAD